VRERSFKTIDFSRPFAALTPPSSWLSSRQAFSSIYSGLII